MVKLLQVANLLLKFNYYKDKIMKLTNKIALISLFACVSMSIQSSNQSSIELHDEYCRSQIKMNEKQIEFCNAAMSAIKSYEQMRIYALYATIPLVALVAGTFVYELYEDMKSNDTDQDSDDIDQNA